MLPSAFKPMSSLTGQPGNKSLNNPQDVLTDHLQDSQAEIAKRQPVLSALSDITSQLSTLSEEPSLTGAEAAVKELSEDVASISARLAKRKELLKVNSKKFLAN